MPDTPPPSAAHRTAHGPGPAEDGRSPRRRNAQGGRTARRPARRRASAALLGAALLLGGCTGDDADPTAAEGDPTLSPDELAALQEGYQQVVQDVLPSVVQITAADGLGSGVVYDDAGHIVTNAHVVSDDDELEVVLATGKQPLDARVVADHPEQDLAVIRLVEPPDDLRPAAFGDSSAVEVGEIVLAMGNPLGLASSVTQGIVSAVGRSVSDGEGSDLATLGNLLQTSAAINPGNSGGALVNLAGEVVGVPTLAAREPELGGQAPGIGFAIPSATVTHLADQLIEHGRVIDSGQAELGASVRTLLGEGFTPAGAAVVEVNDDGPADGAGLLPGDVIIQLADEQVTDVVTLAEALASQQPDDTVEVTWERDGEEHRADVTLDEA